MISHNNFIILCLVAVNSLKQSTAHPFQFIEQISKDETKSLTYSDKNNLSDQVPSELSEDDKLKDFSTLWRKFNLGLIKSLDDSQELDDMDKDLDGLANELSIYDSLAQQNLSIKMVTTTARPSYDQIPRPMLFDRDIESVRGIKKSYQALPKIKIA